MTSSSSWLSSLTTTTTTPVPFASQTPLVVMLRHGLAEAGDFFPFDDVASLDSSNGDRFSFKDLIEDGVEDDSDVTLFSNGCKLPSGEYDCTIACNKTSLFFSGLETFYNCAALASITYRARQGSNFYISDEAERNVSAIMGDGTIRSFERRPVLENFITCAQSSCSSDALGEPCDKSISRLHHQESTDQEIIAAIDVFCPDMAAEIDPDIFGPGVSAGVFLFILS